MANRGTFALLFGLLVCLESTEGGEFCYTNKLEWCNLGCCGTYNDRCCGENVGLIVGCVIGGIAFIAIIVTVVCCCMKKQSYAGRVVQPSVVTTSAIVSYGAGTTTTTTTQQQVVYGPTFGQPPPAFTYSNPV